MTGLYLVLNGLERFMIEKIRVNNHITFIGMRLSQAEIISFSLIITGMLIILYLSITKFRRN